MYGNIEKIKKFLRHKKRSIAKRDLGKIYRKKLSMFDSWSKKKSRVIFYIE